MVVDADAAPAASEEQTERNYQLIENLMSRLQRMEVKAVERRKACEDDLNAASTMKSSRVPRLTQDGNGNDKAKTLQPTSMFLPPWEPGDAQQAAPEMKTFRTFASAATEAGRRLDGKFDDEVGHMFAATSRGHKQKTFRLPPGGARARRSEQHKQDEKKQERVKFERRLQSNLEHFVTRAVTDLRYAVHEQSTLLGASARPPEPEAWPIPVGAVEMNPRLLLSHSCERVALPSGHRMFRHFALHDLSCNLYVFVYWAVHCRFFQPNSEAQQQHLLGGVATLYVKLLSLRALEAHRDAFFRYYPYVVADAVFYGFYYLCPGSRHLYTGGFRRVLALHVARLLTGLDVCASSVLVLQRLVFPDDADAADADADAADALPPLPHSTARKPDADEATALTDGGLTDASPYAGGRPGLRSIASTALLAGAVARQYRATHDLRPSASAPQLAHPLAPYIGSRADLRFRPPLPPQLRQAIPRQRRVAFDTNAVSPLLRTYLDAPPAKQSRVCRTAPVHWCATGGAETFMRTSSSKDAHDALLAEHARAKRAYRKSVGELREREKRDTRALEDQRRSIVHGGSVVVGRYALEIVEASMRAANNRTPKPKD
ncbi:hypothetical protein M885DRAFT_626172 [Pelagophyceae sp. CCMP2097]|nr:hypothetical protein M885DRAFT_626172 [Pelagophyceae sp. CCMP2097]